MLYTHTYERGGKERETGRYASECSHSLSQGSWIIDCFIFSISLNVFSKFPTIIIITLQCIGCILIKIFN